MAKEVITKLIDDIDGGEAAETITFVLDGHTYEIDLSAKNATKLRHAFAVFVDNGSHVSGRPNRRTRSTARTHTSAPVGREQNRAIRDWAQRKGYEVAPRGRIKQGIVDQYQRAAGR